MIAFCYIRPANIASFRELFFDYLGVNHVILRHLNGFRKKVRIYFRRIHYMYVFSFLFTNKSCLNFFSKSFGVIELRVYTTTPLCLLYLLYSSMFPFVSHMHEIFHISCIGTTGKILSFKQIDK